MDPSQPALKSAALQILRAGDLTTLTERSVRRGVETRLGLAEKFLDAPDHRAFIKTLVAQYLVDPAQFVETPASASPSSKKRSSSSASKDVGDDGDLVPSAQRKRLRKKRTVIDSEDEEDEDEGGIEAETPRNEAGSKSSSPRKREESSERKDSDANTQPPTTKDKTPKSKGKAERRPSTAGKESKTVNISEKDQASITKLKKYIKLCGVNKRLDKEMEEMTGKERIQYLRQMLVDLGVKDNPTIEKCKKIQAKRALQAEVQELDTSLIVSGKRR
ncbi:HIRA-interacting protein 3 [Geranomyces variabilis]|uniref:HIRA-interacting protein 3 n=1 Tax=Geranomyces variabilis TaxID=109894 RepID=A0AAD5THF2_9FUNG|nr:HIRA-interacting protein 3 [Geranomyces variabilis]